MNIRKHKFLILLVSIALFSIEMVAKTGRYRLVWKDNPSTSITIGWDQISGKEGKIYFDTSNKGKFPTKYSLSKSPDNVVSYKGMNNHFVRLTGLSPNTIYYFVIADTEGSSKVYSFQTAPDDSNSRLSIIAGSDSRNHRTARKNANKLVSKLRPHCVMFGGDFTDNDNEKEWKAWFDDWQSTISSDGRMYPIIAARGNHEFSNKTLINLFDLQMKGLHYAMSLGGNLLRIYTLNSMIAPGGTQRTWLKGDLQKHSNSIWKTAQHHLSTRPHVALKKENNDQWGHWSKLFYEFGVDFVVESDAHSVKSTYPLRPETGAGSDEGFIRDDVNGTIYIGEGCWGAPLRPNNDTKEWTRASGSFNSFHWIFVDRDKIEIRFIKTDNADKVAENRPNDIFSFPRGLNIWVPDNGTGDVIEIFAHTTLAAPELVTSGGLKSTRDMVKGMSVPSFDVYQEGDDVQVSWATNGEIDGYSYKLERSINRAAHKPIKVISGLGAGSNNYSFTDSGFAKLNPGKQVDYRLITIPPTPAQSPPEQSPPPQEEVEKPVMAARGGISKVMVDKNTNKAMISFNSPGVGEVKARLFSTPKKQKLREWSIPCSKAGKLVRPVECIGIKKGKYVLVVYNGGEVLEKYSLIVP